MAYKKIKISYKDGRVLALNTPYNVNFINEVRMVQTAKYEADKKAWSCHEKYGLVLESLVHKHYEKNPVTVEGTRPAEQYSGDDYQKHIVISYFSANGADWVSLTHIPYNARFVQALKAIPTARYYVDAGNEEFPLDKGWVFRAEHAELVEKTVQAWFTNPVDVHHYGE